MSAFFRISTHPTALASAMVDGNSFGDISFKFCKPIVFMALAVEPILPGWLVLTKTILILLDIM